MTGVPTAIADGIRTSVRFDAARHPDDPAAPGLVVLGASNDVELITQPARELFTELRSPVVAESDETPPTALLALASFARSRPADADRQTSRHGMAVHDLAVDLQGAGAALAQTGAVVLSIELQHVLAWGERLLALPLGAVQLD